MENKYQKIIGIIGGMGPRATVSFEQNIIDYVGASCDKDFPPIISYNNSQIPDRTESLLKDGGSKFVEEIIRTGNVLIDFGADILVMPCNTAHARYKEIQSRLSKPLINMVECVLDVVQKKRGKVAILGTTGVVLERLYEKECDVRKLRYYTLDAKDQKRVMEAIYLIKAGNYKSAVKKIVPVFRRLEKARIGQVILACTELSLIKNMISTRIKFLDSVDILAKATVNICELKNSE